MIRFSLGAAAVASLALWTAYPPSVYASQQDGQGAEAQEAPAKPAQDARASFDTLKAEAEDAMKAWQLEQRDLSKAAKEAGEEFSFQPFDFGAYRERALKIADQAGPELAPEILVWVIQSDAGNTEGAAEVLTLLTDKHVASPALGALLDLVPYMEYLVPDQEKAAAILLKIEQGTTIPALRGHAMLKRVDPLMSKADRESPEFAKMKADLVAASAEIDDADFTDAVDTFLRVIESYGVGCIAPDIAGIDLDGVEFKLSDYRGKVVFLDFWGDW